MTTSVRWAFLVAVELEEVARLPPLGWWRSRLAARKTVGIASEAWIGGSVQFLAFTANPNLCSFGNKDEKRPETPLGSFRPFQVFKNCKN